MYSSWKLYVRKDGSLHNVFFFLQEERSRNFAREILGPINVWKGLPWLQQFLTFQNFSPI
jgi:hypothetical protein